MTAQPTPNAPAAGAVGAQAGRRSSAAPRVVGILRCLALCSTHGTNQSDVDLLGGFPRQPQLEQLTWDLKWPLRRSAQTLGVAFWHPARLRPRNTPTALSREPFRLAWRQHQGGGFPSTGPCFLQDIRKCCTRCSATAGLTKQQFSMRADALMPVLENSGGAGRTAKQSLRDPEAPIAGSLAGEFAVSVNVLAHATLALETTHIWQICFREASPALWPHSWNQWPEAEPVTCGSHARSPKTSDPGRPHPRRAARGTAAEGQCVGFWAPVRSSAPDWIPSGLGAS